MKCGLFFLLLSLFYNQTLAAGTNTYTSTEEQTGLLELYTSEGCSSCPPADRWLSALREHPQLWSTFIPVALHVDYWDYIGWEDPFASASHSARQRRYAREQSLKAVYTPGFVYNGSEWRRWYVSRSVDFPAGNRPGVLRMTLTGHTAEIEFSPSTPLERDLELQVNVALLGFGLETEVRAGENRGKTLAHDFVVLGISRAPFRAPAQANILPGDSDYRVRLDLPDSGSVIPGQYGVVAWLDAATSQRPIQAVGGLLPAEFRP